MSVQRFKVLVKRIGAYDSYEVEDSLKKWRSDYSFSSYRAAELVALRLNYDSYVATLMALAITENRS